ncbi:MAG: hypothetical protein ACKVU1_02940 [bacterium]
MLDTVDLSLSLAKTEYEARLPELQEHLFELEHAIFSAKIPVAIVFEGWAAVDGAVILLTEMVTDDRIAELLA